MACVYLSKPTSKGLFTQALVSGGGAKSLMQSLGQRWQVEQNVQILFLASRYCTKYEHWCHLFRAYFCRLACLIRAACLGTVSLV